MKQAAVLKHEFVEFIPDVLDDGVLYVSIGYATAAHKCCCGCGYEVATPLSPTDWKLVYDGVSVSLDPSIGNWGFPCKSHYWIQCNRVAWAPTWTEREIAAGRARDAQAKKRYFDIDKDSKEGDTNGRVIGGKGVKTRQGFWQRLKRWLSWRNG
jgi:hypothetical protein